MKKKKRKEKKKEAALEGVDYMLQSHVTGSKRKIYFCAGSKRTEKVEDTGR